MLIAQLLFFNFFFMLFLMDCLYITRKQRVAKAQFGFRDSRGLFLYLKILELEVNQIKNYVY